MKNKKNNFMIILALILVIFGISIFLYPIVSNYLAEKNHTNVITEYKNTVSNENNNIDIEAELEKAREYNDNLTGDPLHDPFYVGSGYAIPENYMEILNINGIIGYVEIPKVDIYLPIYHGTSEETLAKGVGHVESTSFPIGGKSRLSVLTGHRGLPSAKLFTDIDRLENGDYILIHVLDQTLMYKVYGSEVIEPQEIEKLQVRKGRDLITLVTCTPYGINTHRLLVYAERTLEAPTFDDIAKQSPTSLIINYNFIGVVIGIILLAILVLIANIIRVISRRKNKK